MQNSLPADDVVAQEANATGRCVAVVATHDRAACAGSVGRETRAYIVSMAPVDLVPTRMSDGDLLAEVTRLAACERSATAALVALLAEVDARQLHLAEGCSSLFVYCTERLRLSEHAAYHRIEAARAVRAFPIILEHLRSGDLTLTAVTLLRPHLTKANHERLLDAARGGSKRDVEWLVRSLAPLPDVPASVRRLPAVRVAHPTDSLSTVWSAAVAGDQARLDVPGTAGSTTPLPGADAGAPSVRVAGSAENPALAFDAAPMTSAEKEPVHRAVMNAAASSARPRPAEIRVLSPERYSLRVTLSAEAHANLRHAQDLLRHALPDGDPAAIVERALTLLVAQLERTKFAAQKAQPRRRARGGRDAAIAPPCAVSPAPPRPVPIAARCAVSAAVTTTEPEGDGAGHTPQPAEVLSDQAVRGARSRGRPSRQIPAAVKRDVWSRDQGRCAFTGAGGRCRETGRLEFHHRLPVADGGQSSAQNLELRCTAHHRHESEHWFGQARPPKAAETRTRSGPS